MTEKRSAFLVALRLRENLLSSRIGFKTGIIGDNKSEDIQILFG